MTIVEQISNHLEYLGYEISKPERSEYIQAVHPIHPPFRFKEFSFGILLSAYWLSNDDAKNNRSSVFEGMNELNKAFSIARIYVDSDFDFFLIESVYPKSYEKAIFGGFMESFNRDYQIIFSAEKGIGKFLALPQYDAE